MEILNNTVIIPCEFDSKHMALVLKIPGKVLFDLYSNGKRCVVRFLHKQDDKELVYEFDIIFASKRYKGKPGDQLVYHFLVTFYDQDIKTLIFESDVENEPSYYYKG